MNRHLSESATGTAPDGLTDVDSLAIFAQTGSYSTLIADLTCAVEEALAIADALELSLVGIDLCLALQRIKSIHAAADLMESHDRD